MKSQNNEAKASRSLRFKEQKTQVKKTVVKQKTRPMHKVLDEKPLKTSTWNM